MPLSKYSLEVSEYWPVGNAIRLPTGFSGNSESRSFSDLSTRCSKALILFSMAVAFSLEDECYPIVTASFAFWSVPCGSIKRV